MPYQCTKTYCHELGLSSAFRQWRANSHCRMMHGYALSFRVTLEADDLDENGWVFDFGGLKWLKRWLETIFDHKTLVAADDPAIDWFREGHSRGVCDVVVLQRTGCEAFATLVFDEVARYLDANCNRVHVVQVECREHGANGAALVA